MKPTFILAAPLAAICLLADTPPITVTCPNGGQTWPRGTRHEITWTWQGAPSARVKIELYEGANWRRTIRTSTADDGSYNWDIPADLRPGRDYRIRISSAADPSLADVSEGAFAITAPSLTVTCPDGGEVWQRGTRHEITWDSADEPGPRVKIELYQGTNWRRTIRSATPNDGSYPWDIPSDLRPGEDYRIRITSTDNRFYTDDSDEFAIAAAGR